MSSTAWWVCKTAEIHPRDHSDLTFLVVVKVKGGFGDNGNSTSWLYNLILSKTLQQIHVTHHNKCHVVCSVLSAAEECVTVWSTHRLHERALTLTAIVVLLLWVLRSGLHTKALSHDPAPEGPLCPAPRYVHSTSEWKQLHLLSLNNLVSPPS